MQPLQSFDPSCAQYAKLARWRINRTDSTDGPTKNRKRNASDLCHQQSFQYETMPRALLCHVSLPRNHCVRIFASSCDRCSRAGMFVRIQQHKRCIGVITNIVVPKCPAISQKTLEITVYLSIFGQTG